MRELTAQSDPRPIGYFASKSAKDLSDLAISTLTAGQPEHRTSAFMLENDSGDGSYCTFASRTG
jgi:hypothetical protein